MRTKKPAKKITPPSRRNEETTSSTYFSPSTDEDQTDYNLPIKNTKKNGERHGNDTRAGKRKPIEPPRSTKNTRHTKSTVRDTLDPGDAVDDLVILGKSNQPQITDPTSHKDKTQTVSEKGTNTRSPTEESDAISTNNSLHARRRNRQLEKRSNDFQIPRPSFFRVIRDILLDLAPEGFKITSLALDALQESAELYLIILFSDSYKCTMHRDRKTLSVGDMQLVRYLRGVIDPGNR